MIAATVLSCCDGKVRAGNPAVLTARFTPPHPDDDVNDSTATATVKKPDRSQVAADSVDVTFDATEDGNAIIVVAAWDVPADASSGTYYFLVIVSGDMTARAKFAFEVEAW